MITILLRTLIVYLALIVTMRLMGKRQIGELEVTDLVTTLLISEIASLPITNQEIPVSYGLIPIVTLLILETTSSVILIRFPALKALVSARPTVLIHKGVLRQKALLASRISPEELMSEIRQQGYADFGQIEEAILEKNGKLTVLPKAKYAPPTAEQMGLSPKDEGLSHIVLYGGKISEAGLRLIGKDAAWLTRELARRGAAPERMFCVTASESGKLLLIPSDKKNPKKEKKTK